MNDTTETDLAELEEFSKQTKSRQKYSEGDFFAFKLSRRKWGFGRIIYDIHKRKKSEEFIAGKNYGLSNLMGHPLIVQVYHHISSTPDITIEELKGKKFRIRKLTPRECFRLMGVDDKDIDKIQASGVSNSSQYKLAGNSIVVDVLYHIFRKMFIETDNESQQLTLF